MTLQQFFRLAGITTALIGIALICFPSEVLVFFDGDGAARHAHFIRFLGTALTGFSVINWYAVRLMHNPEALLIALVANFTSLFLASMIDLLMFVQGMLTDRSILILFLHLGFAFGFGYWIHIVRTQHTTRRAK